MYVWSGWYTLLFVIDMLLIMQLFIVMTFFFTAGMLERNQLFNPLKVTTIFEWEELISQETRARTCFGKLSCLRLHRFLCETFTESNK